MTTSSLLLGLNAVCREQLQYVSEIGKPLFSSLLAHSLSLYAKCPAQPRATPVVAPGKAWWRLVIPVAIKRDIPRQVAEDLDVIGRVGIDSDATRLGKGWQDSSGCAQIRLAELEESDIRRDQGGANVCRAHGDEGRFIVCL